MNPTKNFQTMSKTALKLLHETIQFQNFNLKYIVNMNEIDFS